MKVTLDLTKLLAEGRITLEEHDRLIELSRKETKKYAFAILVALAGIAVVGGVVGLFPIFFAALAESLADLLGGPGLRLVSVLAAGALAWRYDVGFLAALSALGIIGLLGDAGAFYSHAEYTVAITEPANTAVFFAGLAWLCRLGVPRVPAKNARVVTIFARTCVFVVNMSMWIGSLWGSKLAGHDVPALVFVAVWAFALVAVTAWAVAVDDRWVVNAAAVFGGIHFYTQWFERLGASPGSLLIGGLIGFACVYLLRTYNKTAVPAK